MVIFQSANCEMAATLTWKPVGQWWCSSSHRTCWTPRWVLANSWNFTETAISDPSAGTGGAPEGHRMGDEGGKNGWGRYPDTPFPDTPQKKTHELVGGFGLFFHFIYGIILPKLTNSYFSRWLKHVKTTNQMKLHMYYPLVNVYITNWERSTMLFMGKLHYFYGHGFNSYGLT